MRALVLAAAIAAFAGGAAAQSKADLAAVRDTSTVDQTGGRLLRDTVLIKAPAAAIWRAVTDQGAYRAWGGGPASFIDFRVGGAVEVSFKPDGKAGDPGNLKQEITAYIPDRLIVFRNVSSPAPGAAVYSQLAIVLQIEPQADGTSEVSLSQVGYRQGKDFDDLYGFFKTHNPEYLASLKSYAERAR